MVDDLMKKGGCTAKASWGIANIVGGEDKPAVRARVVVDISGDQRKVVTALLDEESF